MEFSCVKTKLAHFCGKPHSQELLKKLQNDFVLQQATSHKAVGGRKANNVEMAPSSVQQHRLNKPMDVEETRVVPEQPSEPPNSSSTNAQVSQDSPSHSTALKCNHATPAELIPNSDRGSEGNSCGEEISKAAEYDFGQSFDCLQSLTHSPYGTVLQPEEWEMVFSNMDEYVTQTRGK